MLCMWMPAFCAEWLWGWNEIWCVWECLPGLCTWEVGLLIHGTYPIPVPLLLSFAWNCLHLPYFCKITSSFWTWLLNWGLPVLNSHHWYSLSGVFSSYHLSSYVTARFSQVAFRPSQYGIICSKFFLVDKKSDLTTFNPTPENLETQKLWLFRNTKKSEFARKEKKYYSVPQLHFIQSQRIWLNCPLPPQKMNTFVLVSTLLSRRLQNWNSCSPFCPSLWPIFGTRDGLFLLSRCVYWLGQVGVPGGTSEWSCYWKLEGLKSQHFFSVHEWQRSLSQNFGNLPHDYLP